MSDTELAYIRAGHSMSDIAALSLPRISYLQDQRFWLAVLGGTLNNFCAYGAQEYAIVQRLLPANQVGSGTGLYNGLAVLFGGVGGSLIPGSLIAITGSFDAGMLSIVVGALVAALVMFVLAQIIKY